MIPGPKKVDEVTKILSLFVLTNLTYSQHSLNIAQHTTNIVKLTSTLPGLLKISNYLKSKKLQR